jgi:hypothetical protein
MRARAGRAAIGTICAVAALGGACTLVSTDDGRITIQRLTPDTVRRALEVDLVVADYLAADDGEPEATMPNNLDTATNFLERTPALSGALKQNGISARTYLLTIGSIMNADVLSSVSRTRDIGPAGDGISGQNIEFWTSLPPDLKPLVERWKRRQR